MADEVRHSRVRWWWGRRPRPKITLALSGFILSVTLAAINAYYAIRGSVVVITPPRQVIIYRDGEGGQSAMVMALRLPMINAADSNHGDVLVGATLRPRVDTPELESSGHVQVTFDANHIAGPKCNGDNCSSLPGLKVSDEANEFVSVPGGQVVEPTLAFPVTVSACQPTKANDCIRLGTFSRAVSTFGGRPLNVRVTLKFFSGATRRVFCRTASPDAAYLLRTGWQTLRCLQSRVESDLWL